MSDYTTINLADAAYFSAISYANVTQNSISWGLSQPNSSSVFLAANALNDAGWVDRTSSLTSHYLGNSNAWHDTSYGGLPGTPGVNQFRVYLNPISKEVVFAFQGSALNANNWLSDLVTDDQGYSQYIAIQTAANSLYKQMSDDPAYAGYTYFADGHSLGGGMAQTFALQNQISGFGQNVRASRKLTHLDG